MVKTVGGQKKEGKKKEDSGANSEQFAPCAQLITLCCRLPQPGIYGWQPQSGLEMAQPRDLAVGLRDGWENKTHLIYGSVPWGWNSGSPLVEKFCTHTQTQNRRFSFGFWLFLFFILLIFASHFCFRTSAHPKENLIVLFLKISLFYFLCHFWNCCQLRKRKFPYIFKFLFCLIHERFGNFLRKQKHEITF